MILWGRNRTASAAVIASLAAMWAPAQAAAQVSGSVLDASGRPVVAAHVQLWMGNHRVAEAITGTDGSFEIALRSDGGDALSLSVQHLGFIPRVIRVAATSRHEVVLRERPVPLGALVAEGARLCPNVEDAARSLWEEMRTHYKVTAESTWVATGFRPYASVVAEGDLGRYVRQGNPFAVRTLRKGVTPLSSVARHGYVESAEGLMVAAEWDHWKYAELGSVSAEHFLEDAFGAAHILSFSTAPGNTGGRDIAFCPRNGRAPGIQGVLTLSADGQLERARWRFLVEQHDERAGGEVVFVPNEGAGRNYLRPAWSVFYRLHRLEGRYYQRVEEYGVWAFGTYDDVQQLIRAWGDEYLRK